MTEPAPVSPCIAVCVLDPALGWCRGCFRTLKEIAAWSDLTVDERRRILSALPERQARTPPPNASSQ